MPLVVFVLLFVLALLLLGFACACFTDHPLQVIARVLSAILAVPPVLEVWSLQASLVLAFAFLAGRHARARPQPSVAGLQRFLL